LSVAVRLAARDPGAANVVAGLFHLLPPELRTLADVWVQDKAATRLGSLGVPTMRFAEDVSHEHLAAAWKRSPAGVIVTGTSHYRPFDSELWSIARDDGTPSLALIDYWSNLPERFQHGWPDMVGAIDPRQVDELAALGVDRRNVIVTGHPWLAHLARMGAAPEPRPAVPNPLRILFVSERIHDDVAEGAQAPWGFDELDSLGLLVEAACRRAQRGQSIEVVVKFHPYENPERISRAVSGWTLPKSLRITLVPPAESAAIWLASSDLVAGIASLLLLEAILAGKPVVSIQPLLIRPNMYPPAQRGYCRVPTDPAAILAQLDDLIGSAEARRRNLADLAALRHDIGGGDTAAAVAWVSAAARTSLAAESSR
jgi:hypothetical protein